MLLSTENKAITIVINHLNFVINLCHQYPQIIIIILIVIIITINKEKGVVCSGRAA